MPEQEVVIVTGNGKRVTSVIPRAAYSYYDLSGDTSPLYERITVWGTRAC